MNPRMEVAIYQSDAAESDPAKRIENLELALAQQATDLLVCPELFSSCYNQGERLINLAETHAGNTAKRITKLAKKFKTAIVYGYPEYDNNKHYNSALCIDKNGKTVINHRKLLLPPGFESEYFEAGDSMSYFSLNGFKFCILICYDAEFPESVRAAALAGAHVIIVPTALSDDWSVVADKVMPTRAFENGVWLLYANHAGSEKGLRYFGGSCIVKPDGQDAARAASEETVIQAEIDIKAVQSAQQRLPYLKKVSDLKQLF